jgi:hypothetical protein
MGTRSVADHLYQSPEEGFQVIRSLLNKGLRGLLAMAIAAPVAAVVVAVSPGTAAAATPDHWGFAYMNVPVPPAAGAVTDPTRQWGSWKTAFPLDQVTVFPGGLPGQYRVVFPHLASTRGFAHVTAVANDARWCQIMLTTPSGVDQIVAVQCYKNGGVPDPTTFTIVYSTSSLPPVLPAGTAHAYVKGNPGGGAAYFFNSTGAAVASTRLGLGTYRVSLFGVGTGVFDGNVQVTSEQPNLPPRRCKVTTWMVTGPTNYDVIVQCYDQANALQDSWFYLSYHRKRAVFGALAPPNNFGYMWLPGLGGPTDFNSVGCVNTVVGSGVGQYLATFPCIGIRESNVQVTAFGGGPNYCNLQAPWIYSGPTGMDVFVRNVICWNGAGVQAAHNWFLTYSSRI